MPEFLRLVHRLVRQTLLAPAASVVHTAAEAVSSALVPAEVAMRARAQLLDTNVDNE